MSNGRDYRHRGNRNRQEEQFRPNEQKIEKIIKEGDGRTTANYADELGKRFQVSGLTTSQIRHFLSHIQNLDKSNDEKKILNEVHLLRAKLAYAAGRHAKGVKDYYEVMNSAIKKVTNIKEFKNLKNFAEAITGFHRLYGGK